MEDPTHFSFPSEIIAILSPIKSVLNWDYISIAASQQIFVVSKMAWSQSQTMTI
jgi:hypothetical protein